MIGEWRDSMSLIHSRSARYKSSWEHHQFNLMQYSHNSIAILNNLSSFHYSLHAKVELNWNMTFNCRNSFQLSFIIASCGASPWIFWSFEPSDIPTDSPIFFIAICPSIFFTSIQISFTNWISSCSVTFERQINQNNLCHCLILNEKRQYQFSWNYFCSFACSGSDER